MARSAEQTRNGNNINSSNSQTSEQRSSNPAKRFDSGENLLHKRMETHFGFLIYVVRDLLAIFVMNQEGGKPEGVEMGQVVLHDDNFL